MKNMEAKSEQGDEVVDMSNCPETKVTTEDDNNKQSSKNDSTINGTINTTIATEKDETDFVIPSDELIKQIINQVEYYFSDESLLKDAFLLKHVRRNKQGFVSIKLITSFKRVKTLTKDYRAVAYALKMSSKMEVNVEQTKVRRLEPLPDHDETTPSRSIVAINLPLDNPKVGNVSDLFKECGEVTLVRILKPNKAYPPEVRKYLTKYSDLNNIQCAIIEFDSHSCADTAVNYFNNDSIKHEKFKNMTVHLLAAPKKKQNVLTPGNDTSDKKIVNDTSLKKIIKKKPRQADFDLINGGGDSNFLDSSDIIDYRNRHKHQYLSPQNKGFPTKHSCMSMPSQYNLSPNNNKINAQNIVNQVQVPHRRRSSYPSQSSPLVIGNLTARMQLRQEVAAPPWLRKNLYHNYQYQTPCMPTSPNQTSVNHFSKKSSPMTPVKSIGMTTSSPRGRRISQESGILRSPRGPDGNGFSINRPSIEL